MEWESERESWDRGPGDSAGPWGGLESWDMGTGGSLLQANQSRAAGTVGLAEPPSLVSPQL